MAWWKPLVTMLVEAAAKWGVGKLAEKAKPNNLIEMAPRKPVEKYGKHVS